MEVIVGHINADFDSLASMVAAKKLYPQAALVFAGSINRNVREYLTLHGDIVDITDLRSIYPHSITRVIVVDTRIADRLGELKEVVEREDVEVFVFDHHPSSPEDMTRIKDYSEITGATTTILLKLLRQKGISITPYEATLFALGIHEDTGSLTFPGTTYDDAESLAYLINAGANMGVIGQFLGKTLTPPQHHLMNKLLSNFHYYEIKGIQVVIALAEIDEYIDGISMVSSKIIELENPDVFFALVKMEDRVHVTGHSRLDMVRVDRVLADLKGGGHPKAASAVVKHVGLEEVEGRLLASLDRNIKPIFTASRIMSGPVRTIPERMTISEASKEMERTGHTAFPVIDDDGNLVGLISRKDLDKAGHHGLGHAPVKGFMSRNIVTVTPDATLQEMQALMTEHAIGRLPVLDQGKIVGIVTRKDLLRALHGASYLRSKAAISPLASIRGEILDLIKRSLPSEIQNILWRISHAAERWGYRAYLVGGIVRDLFLGFPNYDLDIVVEGKGIEFAQVLARELGGRVRPHHKFGTAVIILPQGLRIDVATARTEYYPYPAALPMVESASIRQDLYRRDFSINAMAIMLTGDGFGELLDYFGGKRDLEKRQIRILHNLSFVEDPTRIFRAVRFEQRFNFVMEAQTEALARRAIDMEFVGELTNARIRDELIDILCEPSPIKTICRLDDIGALKKLHPELACREAMKRRFKRIDRHIDQFASLLAKDRKQEKIPAQIMPNRWILYLAALVEELGVEKVAKWAVQMRLKRQDTLVLLSCLGDAPQVIRSLKSQPALSPSQIHVLVNGLPLEARAYIYCQGGESVRKLLHAYLERRARVLIEVDGRDLERLGLHPSPLYTKILNEIEMEVLDGKLLGRREQLQKAGKLVRKYAQDANMSETGTEKAAKSRKGKN
jgi:tRNA nucleotidyltransferase (CCA-adding enzyme)